MSVKCVIYDEGDFKLRGIYPPPPLEEKATYVKVLYAVIGALEKFIFRRPYLIPNYRIIGSQGIVRVIEGLNINKDLVGKIALIKPSKHDTYLGVSVDGILCNYAVVNSQFLIPIPEKVIKNKYSPLLAEILWIPKIIKIIKGLKVLIVGSGLLSYITSRFISKYVTKLTVSYVNKVLVREIRDLPLELRKINNIEGGYDVIIPFLIKHPILSKLLEFSKDKATIIINPLILRNLISLNLKALVKKVRIVFPQIESVEFLDTCLDILSKNKRVLAKYVSFTKNLEEALLINNLRVIVDLT